MPEDFDQWITTAEAAELSGYNVYHVRRLAARGRIEAKKQGRDWFVNRDSMLAYADAVKQLGRSKYDPRKIVTWQKDEDETGKD